MHGRKDGKGGLSAKTVADIRSLILMGIEYAKIKNYPCHIKSKIFYPSNTASVIRVLTKKEQFKLEEMIFKSLSYEKLGILISLYGGLRIGEICALQWKDVDFNEGTLNVNKTIMRIRNLEKDSVYKTKIIIERPKTKSSIRIVPLPEFLICQLKKFACQEDSYILTGTRSFIEPRIYLRKYIKFL
jgi:integrase